MHQVTTIACKINVIFVIIMLIILTKSKILLCSKIDTNPATKIQLNNSMHQERVEEYFIEHKVSGKEAETSFQKLYKELINSKFFFFFYKFLGNKLKSLLFFNEIL